MRIEGVVKGGKYVILDGERVTRSYTLDEARQDTKLAAAIKRNGWEVIPDGGN